MKCLKCLLCQYTSSIFYILAILTWYVSEYKKIVGMKMIIFNEKIFEFFDTNDHYLFSFHF